MTFVIKNDMGELKILQYLLRKLIATRKTVLDFEEACVYLNVSQSYMYKKTACQEIKFYRRGEKGKLYFRKQDLDEYALNEFVN